MYFGKLSLGSDIRAVKKARFRKGLQWLNDIYVKIYIEFLRHVLPMFTRLNVLFQSEKVILTCLHEKLERTFKENLDLFMDSKLVQDKG